MAKTIIKTRYGVTPNDLLNNQTISLRAKGLFAYIQSKPENWDFSVKNISLQCKEGRDAVAIAVKELEDAGYLTRVKKHTTGGFWEIEYILNAELEPQKTSDWKTVNGKTSNGKPVEQSNKELSKQDISNKEEILATATPLQCEFIDKSVEIIKAFESVDQKNKQYYGNKTQRKAAKFLLDTYGEELVIKVISAIPKTNTLPYFPIITTPWQLQEKWVDLQNKIEKWKSTKLTEKQKYKVAF